MKEYQKKVFISTAYSYLKEWYIWGGDDPDGFDCSGLVIECLKSIGFILDKEDATANGIWKLYKEKQVPNPTEGCLVFYFNSRGIAYHVGICVDPYHCINADGGNSKCKTIQDAKKYDAFIKIRPIDKRKSKRTYVNLF